MKYVLPVEAAVMQSVTGSPWIIHRTDSAQTLFGSDSMASFQRRVNFICSWIESAAWEAHVFTRNNNRTRENAKQGRFVCSAIWNTGAKLGHGQSVQAWRVIILWNVFVVCSPTFDLLEWPSFYFSPAASAANPQQSEAFRNSVTSVFQLM